MVLRVGLTLHHICLGAQASSAALATGIADGANGAANGAATGANGRRSQQQKRKIDLWRLLHYSAWHGTYNTTG